MTAGWSLVLPVKDARRGKSRLDVDDSTRADYALSFALDGVRAAVAARLVTEVIVVTSDAQRADFEAVGARVVIEPQIPGLSRAIRAGLEAVSGHGVGTGVLLPDLPALRSHELDGALRLAARHARAIVPDAQGSGTVLTTARAGVEHVLRFGLDSRRVHRGVGYREIAIAQTSGLRNDVDDAAALERTRQLGWGPMTSAVRPAPELRRP